MTINENSPSPIYVQVAELIEDLILKGDIKSEDQAYSTNELSRIYNINPATARKGLNILIDQEILYKKRGLGMFVSSNAKEIIQNKKKNNFYEDFVLAMLKEAEKIGITKGEVIELIQNKR